MQNCQDLSAFLANNTRTENGEVLALGEHVHALALEFVLLQLRLPVRTYYDWC